MKKVVVFLPCAGVSFPKEFVESYLKARTYFQNHKAMDGFELVEYFPAFTPNMAATRNWCVGKMIDGFEGGFLPDVSIWLDIDHELPYDVLVRLLEHTEPVVSGMYYLKAPPYYPIVYEREEYDSVKNFWTYKSILDFPQVDLFEADMVGMGCVKIDREVFLGMTAPYFKYQEHSWKENTKNLEFLIKHGINNNTEEPYFWEQVLARGYAIMVDPKIQLGHVGKFIVREEHWLFNKVKYTTAELEDK